MYQRKLLTDRHGSTAVEFGIIGPVFILMVIGIVELGLLLAAQTLLDNAAFSASRAGKTGYADTGSTQEATIAAAVAKASSGLLKQDRMTLASSAYADYSNVGQPEPFTDRNLNGRWDVGEAFTDVNGNNRWDADQGRSGVGSAGQIVAYTVTYRWPLFTPWLKSMIGSGGIYTLTTRIVVKNEPF